MLRGNWLFCFCIWFCVPSVGKFHVSEKCWFFFFCWTLNLNQRVSLATIWFFAAETDNRTIRQLFILQFQKSQSTKHVKCRKRRSAPVLPSKFVSRSCTQLVGIEYTDNFELHKNDLIWKIAPEMICNTQTWTAFSDDFIARKRATWCGCLQNKRHIQGVEMKCEPRQCHGSNTCFYFP